jgi:hypothetical protein
VNASKLAFVIGDQNEARGFGMRRIHKSLLPIAYGAEKSQFRERARRQLAELAGLLPVLELPVSRRRMLWLDPRRIGSPRRHGKLAIGDGGKDRLPWL